MRLYKSSLAFAYLLSSSLYATTFELSVGAHDFMVKDIKDDGKLGHIEPGTSHTFGLNVGMWLRHKTQNDINILAKAEVFLDNDKDELDQDHIPVWFDMLVDVNGPIYKINNNNELKWYVYMDNMQNTVSCIERQIRQQVGMGWVYNQEDLFFALNGYTGFYYIEIDDDTPVYRGYTRQELDDGDSSTTLEVKGKYNFTDNLSLYAKARRYVSNNGFEELETDYEALLEYKTEPSSFFSDGVVLNLKVKHTKYNFDRFNIHEVDVLPWDNDTLIQVYATLPWEF